jgi:L-alanine-DL-glutamate epimerase-like enolase superfamily enzyme
MKLSWKPYTLRFRHPFRIAHGVRSTTPVVFTRIEHKGFCGYGEAALPPYLTESQESVDAFLRLVHLEKFSSPDDIHTIMIYVEQLAPGNTAAKAAIDIALHDLSGKIQKKPVYELFGADPNLTPCTSLTIGMDSPEMIRRKITEASGFPVLKVKLGGSDDLLLLRTVSECTDKSFSVDVNQGWTDKVMALDMICRMKEMHVTFVEQPFDKDNFADQIWLKERSPLPIIADESCQRFDDIERCHQAFDGINIKLMKCGGLIEAKRMIEEAEKRDLRILIGCMSETSCAVSAAASLTPFVEWADLDGPLLISNNVFDGITYEAGKIRLPARPGTGAVMVTDVFEEGK